MAKRIINKNAMRNLAQYRDMSDEEFEQAFEKKIWGLRASDALEKRIQEKLEEFAQDYDIDDLKANDLLILRALLQNLIALEDYEQFIYRLRQDGITPENLVLIEKIQRVMADIAKNVTAYQTDLNISRRLRKSDSEQSVVDYINGLKEKARQFLESRMSYIYCPKCNTLLGTVWTLYPKEARNKIVLVCNRVLDDGTECGEKVVVGTKELLQNKGTNKKEIMPESML
jgi:RNase P subunit RPR2